MGIRSLAATKTLLVPSLLVAVAGSARTSASPPALPFPATLDLVWLDAPHGLRIDGIDAGDRSGSSVSGAGDMNGDGIGDLIIGAPYASPGGRLGAGETYVVFGRADLPWQGPIGLASRLDGNFGFIINGIAQQDRSGCSVASAGDVNGDGFDDVIIGARLVSHGYYQEYVGEAYVVFGRPTPWGASMNLSSLNGTNGFILRGVDPGDETGRSVSSAGDVNGDGFDDVVIGALSAGVSGGPRTGQAYVVFGGPTMGAGGLIELSSLSGANGFVINGAVQFDRAGCSVSSAGDVNLDDYDDVLIGADFADPNGVSTAGASYVVFGGPAVGSGGAISLSSLNGTDGFVINGIGNGDSSGGSVSSGDVNHDGASDLIIGAMYADPDGRFDAGATYVVLGGAGVGASGSINLSSLNGANGFVLNGIGESSHSGHAVSFAGDLNSDGFGDVVVGARFAAPGGKTQAGESYVVYGGLGMGGSIDLSSLDGVAGFRAIGIDSFDLCGDSVSAVGDINGDGADDVIIGAPSADPGGRSAAGEVYIVCGRAAPPPPSCPGDLNGNGFTNAQDFNILASHFGQAVAPGTNGDLTGDGLVDVSDFNILAGNFGCTP